MSTKQEIARRIKRLETRAGKYGSKPENYDYYSAGTDLDTAIGKYVMNVQELHRKRQGTLEAMSRLFQVINDLSMGKRAIENMPDPKLARAVMENFPKMEGKLFKHIEKMVKVTDDLKDDYFELQTLLKRLTG